MFFLISKAIGWWLSPLNFLFGLLVIVLWLLFMGQRGMAIARRILALCVVALLVLAIFPVGQWLAWPLEEQTPAFVPPPKVDGIILLGGIVADGMAGKREVITLDSDASRLFEFIYLSQKYPKAKLVFTGGSNGLIREKPKEAELIKLALEHIGFNTRRIIWEKEARNTYENVLFTKKLLKPKPQDKWVVVTSALHMPRATRAFKKMNWEIIPYPCSYVYPSRLSFAPTFNMLENFSILHDVIHEYVGLLVYGFYGFI